MASAALNRIGSLPRSHDRATLRGFVTKTLLALGTVTVAAAVGYTRTDGAGQLLPAAVTLAGLLAVAAFAVGMSTAFMPRIAKWTTLPYAVAEGYAVGVVSKLYGTGRVLTLSKHGSTVHVPTGALVLHALVLTLAVVAVVGGAFAAGVRLSARALHVVCVATAAIAIYYLVDLVAGLFGGAMPGLWSAGPWGIGLSLFVVGLAAVNVLADFQYVETALRRGAPREAEWYGAFGIMVSIVWLYLEILRLLSKLQSRN